ncbi:glycosyltransferase family 39 protein [Loigolactobacillus iwatensis]|uniref:glycosyltransferase family 39 protein n=1 Tax=Loigolactobacillus iwatensis TaxID=1267156 RepID=UPI000F7E78D7|nr:glycosyltransferase family 39 protein [Loigolactobacillus iwatensis]
MQTKQKKRFFNAKFDPFLILILLVALFLYGWQIWKAGSANDFYTAAITSMTQSWKNFWYASFDPAGYITVDKPPVALWFMAISAKIFDVHGWSVVLPSVLFGVGSVYLLYRLVTPTFGRVAGRFTALIMTVTPIVVADSRTNNMDATLVFFLLLAFSFLVKATKMGEKRWLFVSFALIGVAFNVKMLQAFMVLPAMYVFYWLAAKIKWPKKLLNLSVATVVLAIFTLAWPLSVDLTSAQNRPYEGGSEHNSVLELAFGYNGSQRLLGQTTGTGGTFPGMSGSKEKTNAPKKAIKEVKVTTGSKTQTTPTGTKPKVPSGQQSGKTGGPGAAGNATGGKTGQGGGTAGAGGGAFDIGTAGITRVFQKSLGRQVSWLLPLALIGVISSFSYFADPKRRWYQLSQAQKELILWLGWLVPVFGFFSVASFFHPYYMIMLAPPIATLAGIGLTTLWADAKQEKRLWRTALLPIAIAVTALLQAWYVADYYLWLSWLIIALAVFSIIIIISHSRGLARPAFILAICTIMLAPTWWSLTPTIAAESAGIPTAGPDLLTSDQQANGGVGSGTVNKKLLAYLEKNQGQAKYLFATSDSGTAAPYIIKTGKAVMAMGGFNGTDPAITLKQFKKLVKNGQLKYYYSSGKSGNTAIVNWIKKHAKKVATSKYGGTTGTGQQTTEMNNVTKGPTNTKSMQGQPTGVKPTSKPTSSGGANIAGPQGVPTSNGSSAKATTKTAKMPTGGTKTQAMQPGGQSSGTLYDLSDIY